MKSLKGGICIQNGYNAVCECLEGYEGRFCELESDFLEKTTQKFTLNRILTTTAYSTKATLTTSFPTTTTITTIKTSTKPKRCKNNRY